jgi:nucleotide-sensitive chloride channel 1A
MQLESGGEQDQDQEEDLEEESISLTIIPQASSTAPTTTAATEAMDTTSERLATPADQESTETPAEALFTALSACANLHPDNIGAGGDDEEEQDQDQAMEGSVLFQNGLVIPGNNAGGLPPALPGSGGWITAENMHEYFDEEGNWKGGNAEGDEEAPEPQLGPGAGTVRPRDEQDAADGGGEAATEGEETKWRRTG